MTTVKVFAPAKINLALHVIGRRNDGYHEIDTLVAFADVGDSIVFRPANALSLTVEGPEAADVPADMDNLALQAAALAANGRGAEITLSKLLPVASGMGGGSADAAASYRGMLGLGAVGERASNLQQPMPKSVPNDSMRRLAEIGADVPMCFGSMPARATGTGEILSFCDLPYVHAVLANPRVPLSTAAVFGALDVSDNQPMPDGIPDFSDAASLMGWLADCRNDLEEPAMKLAPEIGDVLETLGALDGAGLARMSGSGATCFALFSDKTKAQEAEARLKEERLEWWVVGSVLGDQSGAAMPRII
jgi:4-diphosphocytidyl-2-C-methyl-D-erythritol kinase